MIPNKKASKKVRFAFEPITHGINSESSITSSREDAADTRDEIDVVVEANRDAELADDAIPGADDSKRAPDEPVARRRRRVKQDPVLESFFKAVRDDNAKKAQELLKRTFVKNNVDTVDLNDEFCRTALLMASENDNVELVMFLLKTEPRPPDVNREDKRRMRAIM